MLDARLWRQGLPYARRLLFALRRGTRCNLTDTDTSMPMQAVTARPGARFGPTGIRQGSRRIMPEFAWSIYSGMQ